MRQAAPDCVISLFDDTGNLFDDWIAEGYNCYVVDIECEEGFHDGVHHIRADLSVPFKLPIERERIALVSCHPPCDHLAVSGARWFKGKGLRALEMSIACFATAAEVCEESGAPYVIENPVSTISTYWRKSDHHYNPYEYSGYDLNDYYMKTTCLWTGNGYVMPEPFYDTERYARGLVQMAERKRLKNPSHPCPDYPDARIHNAAPGPLRAYFRSITPKGFGHAQYLANRSLM